MTLYVTAPIMPQKEVYPSAITNAAILAECPINNIAIYLGATVEIYRHVELKAIIEGALDYVRDHNYLELPAGFDTVLYAGQGYAERGVLTITPTYADMGDADIFIGIGATTMAAQLGFTNWLAVAFGKLLDHIKENNLIG